MEELLEGFRGGGKLEGGLGELWRRRRGGEGQGHQPVAEPDRDDVPRSEKWRRNDSLMTASDDDLKLEDLDVK